MPDPADARDALGSTMMNPTVLLDVLTQHYGNKDEAIEACQLALERGYVTLNPMGYVVALLDATPQA